MSKMNIMCLLLVGMFVAGLCCSQQVFAIGEPGVPGKPDGAGGKPNDNGNDSGAGNCLSMPVIWSDGVTRPLRVHEEDPDATLFAGDFWSVWYEQVLIDEIPVLVVDENGDPVVDEICHLVGGVCICPVPADDPPLHITWPSSVPVEFYTQQDKDNVWQAENLPAIAPVDVTWIDWGDNLEAVDWNENSKVRVEVTLWQDISLATMDAFEMTQLFGLGIGEVWGTNTVVYPSIDATVYSGCARLTIQKLNKSHLDPLDPLDLTWNPTTNQWDGDGIDEGALPQFNGGVWEAEDGPAFYSAEINVSGKCIYGYNWDVSESDEVVKWGSYRLTFSLEDNEEGCPVRNTFFTEGATTIMLPVEEVSEESESVIMESDGGEEPVMGGVAMIDYENNLTYIDLNILEK